MITLEYGETKNQEARSVPIIAGDMVSALSDAKRKHDEQWPLSPWVFSRSGEPVRDFKWAWREACKRAGVPNLSFHDLRRTAVRNMRRAGIPQVIRMKISGHKTDSMERRYNIVDAEDLGNARDLLERRPTVSESIDTPVGPKKPDQASDGAVPRAEGPNS